HLGAFRSCTQQELTLLFFFSSRRRHTRSKRDWSSDVCSSDLDDCNKNEDLEKIIEYSTVFEDGNIYKEKLSEISWLTDEQIEKLSNIHFKGWGRLSKKLLT